MNPVSPWTTFGVDRNRHCRYRPEQHIGFRSENSCFFADPGPTFQPGNGYVALRENRQNYWRRDLRTTMICILKMYLTTQVYSIVSCFFVNTTELRLNVCHSGIWHLPQRNTLLWTSRKSACSAYRYDFVRWCVSNCIESYGSDSIKRFNAGLALFGFGKNLRSMCNFPKEVHYHHYRGNHSFRVETLRMPFPTTQDILRQGQLFCVVIPM